MEFFLQQAQGVGAESGYTGGRIECPPTSRSAAATGPSKAAVIDPRRATFEALANSSSKSTTTRSTPGPTWRTGHSAIFYKDADQKKAAEKLVGQLQTKGLKVATRLEPLGAFWPAEANHQDYYFRKGTLPYCHQRVKRFD